MYVGFYNFYPHYNANRMFTDPSSPIGDDLMYPFVFTGQRLRQMGHQAATLDTDALEKFDAAVFLDHPTLLNPYFRKLRGMPHKKLYLFLFENPANRPDNYWRRNHQGFEKVFTWSTDWIDHRKYIRFWYPLKTPGQLKINPSEKTKFCVTIASQKYNPHPRQFYGERVNAIRWFEANHPEEFDLYGTYWDRAFFTGGLSRLNLVLQKLYGKFPKAFRTRRFPSHRGTVASKNAVMRQYKFALAYENAGFGGYVTEKIFDAWFAGCVPVYLGAPNVTDYIPAETFIDRRQFGDYEQLYRFMKTMPDKQYRNYLAAIEEFVQGEKIKPFGAEHFADTIVRHIVQGADARQTGVGAPAAPPS
jgi:alpha(1,3/1,4) fucosyltransferase